MADRDADITEQLLKRDEDGIACLHGRHGRLGMQIAYNILQNDADAEECLADALQAMWEQIPPNHPEPLLPYFLRAVRNLALKRRRTMTAQKRSCGEVLSPEDWDTVAELELTSACEDDSERIRDALNGFLGGLRREDRILFVRRYWFEDDPAQIAGILGISENHARVRLTRCKKKLRAYLEKEGITL
ncbi:MAG: sigma-70 family RNA polymerase sigma factor [Ruminococcaceae bacterium]|nr:sigma-70 family RNA polymerase sigma factor [Oscillospiraceae bacterium]